IEGCRSLEQTLVHHIEVRQEPRFAPCREIDGLSARGSRCCSIGLVARVWDLDGGLSRNVFSRQRWEDCREQPLARASERQDMALGVDLALQARIAPPDPPPNGLPKSRKPSYWRVATKFAEPLLQDRPEKRGG